MVHKSHKPGLTKVEPGDRGGSQVTTNDTNEQAEQRANVEHGIETPPASSFRFRSDGGVDRTCRMNFVGRLTPVEMRQITEVLMSTQVEGSSVGLIALTKLEFIEPDTCEFRYWCEWARSTKDTQMAILVDLWDRLHTIHAARDVNGLRYPWPNPARRSHHTPGAPPQDANLG